jgi:FAD:protein FMN transferase
MSASLLALLTLWSPLGYGADLPLITWQGQTMGSTYTVKIVDAPLTDQQVEALKSEVEQRLKEVNRQMSHYQPDSEISRFNRAPANTPFKVPPEFALVVRHSLDLNRRSGGAFDPTLGTLIGLWGFGAQTGSKTVPPQDQVGAALANTGCQHLTLTAQDQLSKDIPGLELNLSSPAKGFGSDEMARVLRAHGLTNVYVAISGDVLTMGHNPKGQKWQVGVAAPVTEWRPGDPLVTVLSVSDLAVSTSGDYQKYFVDAQGRRLGHIFDPKTGWPVQHTLGSVSVVAGTCMLSSSLATTLFVLGPEAGPRFIETFTNAAALFVVRGPDGNPQIIPSSRFAAMTGYQP